MGMAAGLANLAVPGLGVLALAAKWGVQGVRAGRHASEAAGAVDAAGLGRSDLVGELAPALERLGAAGLPIVIVIEDLHLADTSLVELLARLLAAQDARVLVISTAWRGLLDEPNRPANQLLKRVSPDRTHRVLADDDLSELAPTEREEIAARCYPTHRRGMQPCWLSATQTRGRCSWRATSAGYAARTGRSLLVKSHACRGTSTEYSNCFGESYRRKHAMS
jgi:hypothetical protein